MWYLRREDSTLQNGGRVRPLFAKYYYFYIVLYKEDGMIYINYRIKGQIKECQNRHLPPPLYYFLANSKLMLTLSYISFLANGHTNYLNQGLPKP